MLLKFSKVGLYFIAVKDLNVSCHKKNGRKKSMVREGHRCGKELKRQKKRIAITTHDEKLGETIRDRNMESER